jgi:hypothetical protein
MSDTEQVGIPPDESLRRHVLEPLATAESVLDNEYEEIAAERRAFEQFKNRVAGIGTVSDTVAVTTTPRSLGEERSRGAERVRSVFRETVMDVDHYDEVYGESLIEHARAELSEEIAAGLRRDAHLQFTHLYKQTLVATVETAIEQRETVCTTLASERKSLARNRDGLRALLDELDGTRVPAGTRAEFADALDEIARQRQETVARRTGSPRTDGHDFCAYLYAECAWTYPVLTAVTRLRGTVTGAVT